jgi:hypothetical protein
MLISTFSLLSGCTSEIASDRDGKYGAETAASENYSVTLPTFPAVKVHNHSAIGVLRAILLYGLPGLFLAVGKTLGGPGRMVFAIIDVSKPFTGAPLLCGTAHRDGLSGWRRDHSYR